MLASIMAIGSAPVNAFAVPQTPAAVAPFNFSVGTGVVANTRLSRAAITAPTRAAFIEAGARTGASGSVSNSNLIENWVEGSNLHVIFNEAINNATLPIEFTLELDNAVWFFRNSGAADVGNLGSPTFNPANGSWDVATNTYTRTVGDIHYRLQVSQANPSRATVTLINTAETVPVLNKFKKNAQPAEETAAPQTPPANEAKPAESAKPALKPAEPAKPNQAKPAEAPKPVEIIKPAPANKENEVPKEKQEKTAPVDAMSVIDDLAREARFGINTAAGSFVRDAHSAVLAAREYVRQAQGAVSNSPASVRTNITNAISRVNLAIGHVQGNDLTSIQNHLNTALSELNGAYSESGTIEVPDTENPDAGDGEDTNNPEGLQTPEPYNNGTNGATTLPGNLPNTTTPTPLNQDNQTATTPASYATISPLSAATVNTHLSAAYAALTAAENELFSLLEDEEENGENGNGENGNGNGNGNGTGGISIANGDHAIIPLVVRNTGNEGDVTVRVIESSLIPMQTHTLLIARGVAEGATRVVTRAVAVGRDRIELEPIGIFENRPGAFPASGSFEFLAPSGFHFASVNGVRIVPEGGLHGNGFTAEATIVPNSDARTVRITYSGLAPSTTLTGQLAVTGLVLLNSSLSGENIREGEITMQIRNVSGQPAVVTPQSFAVAQVTDWRINLTRIGDAPELLNGRLSGQEMTDIVDEHHRAARIRVEEIIPNAWWAQRSTVLNLPEGVRIRRAEFRNVRNIRNSEVLNGSFYNDRARGQASSYVRVNDNQIIVSGLDVVPEQRASFELELWLNIEAGFEGDIPITLGGSAVTGVANSPTVTVATAVNPITVTTNIQNVRMGYDFVPIGNFAISENRAGALLGDEEVYISITDQHFTELQIAPGFRVDVTEGDIRISNPRVATHLGSLGRSNQAWRIGANAAFDVERESTIASTIEFSGVQTRISPVLPIPSAGSEFNLVVWGPAVAANYEGIRETDNERINRHDFFNTPGVVERIVTGISTTGFTNVVRITANNPILLVNNEQMLMDTSAYISTRSNSMMIPVRFVAMALGLEAGRVLWSPETSTVTVDAGERILQFRINSSVMLINGIEFPMLNAAGQPVFAEIRDDRAFIPFRALSEALNVYVEWEPSTATATFDPRRSADRDFHPEDLMNIQYASFPKPASYYENNYNRAMNYSYGNN